MDVLFKAVFIPSFIPKDAVGKQYQIY